MLRLTVHVTNAPFVSREQKVIDKGENNKPITKPKRSKCIVNTFSFKGFSSIKDVETKLSNLRSKYNIAKWDKGDKKGKEMIYISYC